MVQTFSNPTSFGIRLLVSSPIWIIFGVIGMIGPIASGKWSNAPAAVFLFPFGLICLSRTFWHLMFYVRTVTADDRGITGWTYWGRRVTLPWSEVTRIDCWGDGVSWTDVKQALSVRSEQGTIAFTNLLSDFDELLSVLQTQLPGIPREKPSRLARIFYAW